MIRRSCMLNKVKTQRMLLIFLIPGAMALILFNYIPMVGIVMAFQNYEPQRGFIGSEFIGFENFRSFLREPDFYIALRNTLGISFFSMIFSFPAPIILALILDHTKSKYFKRISQTITYLPHFLSWVILASLVYRILADDGIVNLALQKVGLTPVSFMRKPSLYWTLFITISLLKEVGWSSIIYLAAISSIDQELYQAASIDGANRLAMLRDITLPSIAPTIALMFVLNLGTLVTVNFDAAFNLMNPLIMPRADVIDTYVYRTGILLGRFSYSTAVGLCQSIISFLLFFIGIRVAKKHFNYSLL